MSQLEVRDDCRTAEEVFRRAKAVMDRRMQLYSAPSSLPPIPVASVERDEPSRKMMWSCAIEVARQLAIDPDLLRSSLPRQPIPLPHYRQLAMALALHLTGKSTSQVGRAFNVDHTTAGHAQRRMAPIINAVGLTDDNSLAEWVAAALPLLFAYLEEMRRARSRQNGQIEMARK